MGKEITSISMRRPEPEPAVQEVPESVPIPKKTRILSQLLNLLQYPLFAIIGVAVIYDGVLGQMMIGTFGAVSLLFRVPSKQAFGAALFILITVPLFIALHRQGIADTLAVYVFELLVVGTVLAIVELRREGVDRGASEV